jgi:hypothetical protein
MMLISLLEIKFFEWTSPVLSYLELEALEHYFGIRLSIVKKHIQAEVPLLFA